MCSTIHRNTVLEIITKYIYSTMGKNTILIQAHIYNSQNTHWVLKYLPPKAWMAFAHWTLERQQYSVIGHQTSICILHFAFCMHWSALMCVTSACASSPSLGALVDGGVRDSKRQQYEVIGRWILICVCLSHSLGALVDAQQLVEGDPAIWGDRALDINLHVP